MQRVIITLVCDLCGSENDVKNHTVKLDRRSAKKDACMDCWGFVVSNLKDFMAKG